MTSHLPHDRPAGDAEPDMARPDSLYRKHLRARAGQAIIFRHLVHKDLRMIELWFVRALDLEPSWSRIGVGEIELDGINRQGCAEVYIGPAAGAEG